MKTNIVDIFCIVDNFSKLFDQTVKEKSIEKEGKKRRNRKSRMSDGEVMTILILFHLSRYRDLKAFYLPISQSLFDRLFVDDIHMITRIKKNMKNSLMHLYDKVLLRKRALIETVNDMLKNVCQIEHTRHRSVNNFLTNLISGLIAYNFLSKKPELNIEIVRNSKLPTCT